MDYGDIIFRNSPVRPTVKKCIAFIDFYKNGMHALVALREFVYIHIFGQNLGSSTFFPELKSSLKGWKLIAIPKAMILNRRPAAH